MSCDLDDKDVAPVVSRVSGGVVFVVENGGAPDLGVVVGVGQGSECYDVVCEEVCSVPGGIGCKMEVRST